MDTNVGFYLSHARIFENDAIAYRNVTLVLHVAALHEVRSNTDNIKCINGTLVFKP